VKNRFLLALVALIISALTLPVFVLAQQKQNQSNTAAGTSSTGKTGPSTVPPIRRPRVRNPNNPTEAVAQDFSEALSIIQDKYIDGNKIDYNNAYKSSISGMLRSLDPHSNYFDREEFEEMRTEQRSEYFGIGASILNYSIGESLDTYIAATFQNAPASRAGLRFGDRIDAVDGVSMHGKLSGEVRDKIRGPRGSHVKLTLTRASSGLTETVEIVRDAVPQPSVPDAYMIRPGVGYIDMTRGFNYDTAERLKEALAYLHSNGMTSLVLDLRNNPGGFLDQAIRVADVFLPAGQVILTQKGRDGLNDHEYKARNTEPDRTPLVVLVNEYTASASEIVAGAMQDHDRALIVGQTSFGKGLVQSIISVPDQCVDCAGLTLTSAKYYTPSGRLIQRDYSNGDYYNYIYRGGTLRNGNDQSKPVGPASKTDTGRPVYGGGGITPDESVKPGTFTPPGKLNTTQARLRDPIFFFARNLATGRVAGLDKYKVDRPIEFGHDMEPADFPISDEAFKAFSDYVAKDANWKSLAPLLDRNRSFIETQLRFSLATAAYGTVTAQQVWIREDPQVAKAVEVEPRARDLANLARTTMRARTTQP
jgi:carboxyl-terminal processing protease